ncbi:MULTISPECIES: hypothetical protein [unclassified Cellulophaga]|uniref:hypothetical protein n=1 Tax=unclassified Cellulophaga TaxID=2634405 RepID=UPI0026E24883|nr:MULTISPECIES: hypothetical protein [unclassified Cellulophaga]MDO6491780.1 hypothetical protein [Cellulophaga sp. 2_MG-2023]MDO6495565.1 hypothetical protein [Cellulophaga sp. 3_MG-2023]
MLTININLDDRKGFYSVLKAFDGVDKKQDITLNLNHKCGKSIQVEKYPVLCSIVNEVRSLGFRVVVNLEIDYNCKQLQYAARMGFLEVLGLKYNYPHAKHSSRGRFIEIENIPMSVSGAYYPKESLTELFVTNFGFTKEEAQDVTLVIGEMGNNCVMHSESKGGAMLYSQKYNETKFLNLFLVDSGVGIVKGMLVNKKYDNLTEKQIFAKAFEFGEGNGRGYGQGLFLVSEFLRLNNGYLQILSGKYRCVIESGRKAIWTNASSYDGVIIKLRIPYNIKFPIDKIMKIATNDVT